MTKIPYVTQTWETTGGCSKCSSGCQGCYAIRQIWRLAHNPATGDRYKGLVEKVDGKYQWTGKVKLFEDRLDQPLHWRQPRSVFVNSRSDTFHPDVNIGFLTHVFDAIEQCPQHKFLILTKRPERTLKMMWGKHGEGWRYFGDDDFHKNIYLGTTICNQAEKVKGDILRTIPAAYRWWSIEPLLENLGYLNLEGVDWLVVGCESGPNRRPCKIEWMIDVVEQCKAAGVKVLVKQVSINGKVSHNMAEWPGKLRERETI